MEHDGIFSGTFGHCRAFTASSGKTVTSRIIRLNRAVNVAADVSRACALTHCAVFGDELPADPLGFSALLGSNW